MYVQSDPLEYIYFISDGEINLVQNSVKEEDQDEGKTTHYLPKVNNQNSIVVFTISSNQIFGFEEFLLH